ncbi:MAG: hypothetical protein NTW21_29115 [Verrucomicrobia bacterium]|nr:hypothetical protein [Verrucomicrobiota bacterium]
MILLTKANDSDTVYAFPQGWTFGNWRNVDLKCARATTGTVKTNKQVIATIALMMAAGIHNAPEARGGEADTASGSPRIVNIVNFIRQCEPRIEWITPEVLYDTVVEQVNIMYDQ